MKRNKPRRVAQVCEANLGRLAIFLRTADETENGQETVLPRPALGRVNTN